MRLPCGRAATTAGAVVGAGHVVHLVQQVVCQKVDANWRKSYAAVSRVVPTVRASSAVECMNGACCGCTSRGTRR